MRRRRKSLIDTFLVWGFLLSFLGLFGVACVEAFKIVSVVPAAFSPGPIGLQNPMTTSDDDRQPSQTGRTRMTPRQRAEYGGREP